MSSLKQDLVIFKTNNNEITLEVRLDHDTVWLNLNQLAQLFERDKSVISRHLRNIFQEGELESSTVAEFATVQQEGTRSVRRGIDHYSLDVVIALGYRINSKRGMQFRQWASKILKGHLVRGYSLNQDRLQAKGADDLRQAVDRLSKTLQKQSVTSSDKNRVMEIISHYAQAWRLLLAYDEDRLSFPTTLVKADQMLTLDYKTAHKAIQDLKEVLTKKGEAFGPFGQQRDEQLKAILGTINQTFARQPLYTSLEERAAHLLYFIIKDHPFVDGNKRIGSFLFLLYLQSQGVSLQRIDNSTLVSLALLVAESDPKDKKSMIKLIINLIVEK